MDVIGIVKLVSLRLKVVIFPSSNGRDQKDAIGIVLLIPLQLEVVIFPSSNG